ncbi:MAG: hypothetical protein MUD17_12260 [Gemmatimonadaceae bacterium]|jgi:hypothetical protein|nr:hypothetical protein [Gemmatimonadaceae bacterium]
MATTFGSRLFVSYYPEEMTKTKHRPRRETPAKTPYEEARDELFQHIMNCGVIGAHPDDQVEWFDETMKYMTTRYTELTADQLRDLRALGMRFSAPMKSAITESETAETASA